MPTCYFLGGYGGSELSFAPPSSGVLWCSYTALALGGARRMALAADGITPLPPNGRQLVAGGLYEAYYGRARQLLAEQLGGDGYTVQAWPMDWRLRLRTLGQLLAAEIMARIIISNPCSVVAHSTGGLVARAAWAELVAAGKSGLVRRIVTLGTPHWGTYRVAEVWRGQDEAVQQLQLLSYGPAAASAPLAYALGLLPYSRAELVGISQTWVSLYQLLPVLDSPPAAQDPHRANVYVADRWHTPATPSQVYLNEARDSWGPFVRSAASMPPSWVLTTVAGSGVPTSWRLAIADGLGLEYGIDKTAAGDGTVTVDSALLQASAQLTVNVAHNELPLYLANTGQLAELVKAVRVAPAPPPPAVVQGGPMPVGIGGPPIPMPPCKSR